MGLLTEELRDWIGREARYQAREPLGRAAIRYFALAIGDDNPLYTDADFARAHGHSDVIAPPTLVCETNQYATGPISDEGYVGHRWDLPVPGCRVVRGGHEYTFHRPLRPDDVLTVTWHLRDLRDATSSTGADLLVVTSEATYHDAGGDLLATQVETIIYQRLAAP